MSQNGINFHLKTLKKPREEIEKVNKQYDLQRNTFLTIVWFYKQCWKFFFSKDIVKILAVFIPIKNHRET